MRSRRRLTNIHGTNKDDIIRPSILIFIKENLTVKILFKYAIRA